MDKKRLSEAFASPSAAWRGKPFWAWNGELKTDELIRQVRIMKEMGLGGFFMHSRSGLITDYLGDEWFACINAAADAAEREGMEAWLYDEDRWPSGSAGGKATVDPRYRMKSLYVYESEPEKTAWPEGSFALFAARMDGIDLYEYRELDASAFACGEDAARAATAAVRELAETAGEGPGAWKALRFAIVPDEPSSGYNGTTYIDTMSRAATDRFIELTHEEYARHCGDRLGRSIKGIFTDEPHRGHCFDNLTERDGVISCATAWTDDIFEEFEKRYGFTCRPILPELFFRKNGEKVAPVKLFYIDLANALFLERFAAPIRDWCAAHNMLFTGHVLHEDSLMNQTVPNGSLMRFYEYMSLPGVDVLTEDNRCYWIVKQLASAARQLGRPWMLSELYGCTGWQFGFKGHKNVGDWQALFGINLRCQHLSWYTMEGEAKRDYPASILHQSPWYPYYKTVEEHFARLGLVLAEGEPDCGVLVLNPIESLWCQAYAGWANWIWNNSADIEPYEERYQQLFHFLTGRQIDFDYGEEEMLSRLAAVEETDEGPVLRVGKAVYHTVIVSDMLTARPSTLGLLRAFIDRGGHVIFCGEPPAYVNAVRSGEPAALAARAVSVPFEEDALVSAVLARRPAAVSVATASGEPEPAVFAQVRRAFCGNGDAVVVLNTDREAPRENLTLTLRAAPGRAAEEWDLDTGARFSAAPLVSEDGCTYTFRLDPEAGGTRCFVLSPAADPALSPRPVYGTVAAHSLSGPFPYRRAEPNVCVLDLCRRRLPGGAWSGENEALEIDREIRAELGLEPRGGGMLQPWYAKHFDRKEYGELELSFAFYADTLPVGPVFLAGERPELNRYAINGEPLSYDAADGVWIDDCFKKLRLPAGALKPGRNEIAVRTVFRRTTNVEALYLVGDFGVRLDGLRRTLTALPETLGCGDYADHDMPFYTGNMTYVIPPERYLPLLKDAAGADRIALAPEGFTGACVLVEAAGKEAVLGWEPYEADVTAAVRAGEPIEVTVVGTRANVFGDLHEQPDRYTLIGSGLGGIAFRIQKRRG